MILQVRTDEPRSELKSVRYTILGPDSSEPRSANSVPEAIDASTDRLIQRPYPIASTRTETQEFEFYISQVKLPTLTDADEAGAGHRLWIEEILEREVLNKESGIAVDPDQTHFFLCGNPRMVENVSALLAKSVYTRHRRNSPGSLHIEGFWS